MKLTSTKGKWTATNRDSIIPFGKWKGYTIGYVADNDPDYILWLADEGIIKFSSDLWKMINAIERDSREQYHGTLDAWWDMLDPPY